MPLKYATILYVTKDKAYLHSSLRLVFTSDGVGVGVGVVSGVVRALMT